MRSEVVDDDLGILIDLVNIRISFFKVVFFLNKFCSEDVFVGKNYWYVFRLFFFVVVIWLRLV